MEKDGLYFQILLYAACCLLVVAFVHLYGVFTLLDRLLPSTALVLMPIAAVALVFILFAPHLRVKSKTGSVNWRWVIAGALLCAAALTIPDSRYPVKRIHVLEYMALSCLVRYVMSWRLQCADLLFFSVLATIAFGVHDEILQGIHPHRTYGHRDILVNTVSALGGGLIWHGTGLFNRSWTPRFADDTLKRSVTALSYLLWLVLSVLGFIIPLAGYKNTYLPYWTLLPLSASLVFWSLYHFHLQGGVRYGCQVLSCLAYTFFCYPVVINNAVSLTFH